jgi:hypothetical protein
MIKSSRIRWTRHAAGMEKRYAYNFCKEFRRKRTTSTADICRKIMFKMNVSEIECDCI